MEPTRRAPRQWDVDRTEALASENDLAGLYEELWLPMLRLTKLLVGSDAVAEDLVQEAFIAVSPKLHVVANPAGYLRIAVVNRARGWHRRTATADRHRSALASVTGDPEIDETWQVLHRLPLRQRAVLVLRYYEDLSEAEVAKALGWRPGTVKSTTHRALARLRKELS